MTFLHQKLFFLIYKSRSDFLINQINFFYHRANLNFLKRRGYIHKQTYVTWFSYMFHVCNISFISCIIGYIGHESLEVQNLSGRNGCLTPSHSITQPLNLVSLDRQTQALCSSFFFFLFSFFFFWIDCNQDTKPCNTQFIKFFFYSINDNGTIQSCKVVFNFFLFFCIKKISGDSTLLIQKERCP